MKRIINIALALFMLAAFSCSKQKAVVKYTPEFKDIEADTLTIPTDSIEVAREAPPQLPDNPIFDEYSGYLPCADCPGISYKLTLKPDSTYSEVIAYADLAEYEDKSEDSYIYTGSFSVKEDTVFLDKDEDAIKYLLIHPHGLQLLDTEKQLIEGDFSEKYVLQKRTAGLTEQGEPDSDHDRMLNFLQRKAAKGIDFFATGSEPDWLLDIDFDSLMSFRSLTNPAALQTPVPAPEQTEDSKIVNYFAQTEAGVLDVTISSEPCENTMSGQKFPYKVRVEAKDSMNSEFHTFEGCGRYLVDISLQNQWYLISMNGKELTPDDFAKGLPVLEFDLDVNRFSGNAGCNRISGDIIVRPREISFGRIISTKMICGNIELETHLINLLNENTFSYKLQDSLLIFENPEGAFLKFDKAE